MRFFKGKVFLTMCSFSLKMASKWSKDDIRELMLKYEMSLALWDIHSAEYRNRTIKQKALEELTTEFCVDGVEIQTQLHILRSQYQQELRKTIVNKVAKVLMKSDWKHFDNTVDLTA